MFAIYCQSCSRETRPCTSHARNSTASLRRKRLSFCATTALDTQANLSTSETTERSRSTLAFVRWKSLNTEVSGLHHETIVYKGFPIFRPKNSHEGAFASKFVCCFLKNRGFFFVMVCKTGNLSMSSPPSSCGGWLVGIHYTSSNSIRMQKEIVSAFSKEHDHFVELIQQAFPKDVVIVSSVSNFVSHHAKLSQTTFLALKLVSAIPCWLKSNDPRREVQTFF